MLPHSDNATLRQARTGTTGTIRNGAWMKHTEVWGRFIRREGASEATPEVVRQAVGGGCETGCGVVTVGYERH